jgi:hypothetical protein
MKNQVNVHTCVTLSNELKVSKLAYQLNALWNSNPRADWAYVLLNLCVSRRKEQ